MSGEGFVPEEITSLINPDSAPREEENHSSERGEIDRDFMLSMAVGALAGGVAFALTGELLDNPQIAAEASQLAANFKFLVESGMLATVEGLHALYGTAVGLGALAIGAIGTRAALMARPEARPDVPRANLNAPIHDRADHLGDN